MTYEDSLRQFGLAPGDSSLPAIRQLLAQEAEAERNGTRDAEELAFLCSVQLFSRGHLEDVLLIWDAKMSGMDLGFAIDVQLLCGPGLAETKAFLSAHGSEQAARAVAYIRACEAAGDFDDFSVETRMDWYRQYFGVGRD